MKRTLLITLPFLICLVPVWAWSGTYYVTASGGGTTWANCTSRSTPCTLATANANAVAGDTVIMINDGGNFTTHISPSNDGSSGNYITFEGESGTTVTLASGGTMIQLVNRQYIHVKNLHLAGDHYLWLNIGTWGTCSDPSYESEDLCKGAGKIWTSPPESHHIIVEDITTPDPPEGAASYAGALVRQNGAEVHDITLRNLQLRCTIGNEEYTHSDCMSFVAYGYTYPYDIYRVLIEDCTIKGGVHNALAMQQGGSDYYNFTLRNNDLSNPNHTVLNINEFSSDYLHHYLLENNKIYDGGSICAPSNCDANVHGSPGDKASPRWNHPGVQHTGGNPYVFRYNELWNNGSAFYWTGSRSLDHVQYYNNTIYGNGYAFYWNGPGVNDSNAIINNIISEQNVTLSGSNMVFNVNSIPTSPCDHTITYNDIYDTATSTWKTCDENLGGASVATLESTTDDFSNNITTDPLFIDKANNDFTLQSDSPAIDAGSALTTVSSGCGTSSLVVANAAFFQDGTWEPDDTDVVDADWVAVGTVGNVHQISSINYSTNTLTFASAVSCANGAKVWLYKDSDGTVVLNGSAPDMGANETGPAAPKNLKIVE